MRRRKRPGVVLTVTMSQPQRPPDNWTWVVVYDPRSHRVEQVYNYGDCTDDSPAALGRPLLPRQEFRYYTSYRRPPGPHGIRGGRREHRGEPYATS
jgi:hypothetical protein